MNGQIQKGYYIGGVGVNTGRGRTCVGIEYGQPVDPSTPWLNSERLGAVHPREKIFELFRLNPESYPGQSGVIYVKRHNPTRTLSGILGNAVPLPATPELNAVFDIYLPKWEAEGDKRHQDFEGGKPTTVIQVRVEGLDAVLEDMPITPE